MPDGIFDPKQGQLYAAFSAIADEWQKARQSIFDGFSIGSTPTALPTPIPPTRYERFTESVNEWVSTAGFRVTLLALAFWRGAKYGIERARQRADELFFEE